MKNILMLLVFFSLSSTSMARQYSSIVKRFLLPSINNVLWIADSLNIKGNPLNSLQYIQAHIKKNYLELDCREKGRLYLSSAVFAHLTANPEMEEENFKLAYDCFNSIHEQKFVAYALNGLGDIAASKGHSETALSNYQKVLDIQKNIADSMGLSVTYTNIAILYEERKFYFKSLENLALALTLAKQQHLKTSIILTLIHIANINIKIDNFQKAKLFLDQVDSIKVESQFENMQEEKFVNYFYHEAHGLFFYKRLMFDAAEFHFKERLLCAQFTGDKNGCLRSYLDFGELYLKTGRTEQSIKSYNQAFKLAKENKGLKDQCESLYGLSKIYKKLGKLNTAIDYFTAYDSLNKIFLNDEKVKSLTDLEFKYESRDKDRRIELLTKDKILSNAELQKQKIIRNSIAGGTGVIILFSVFSFLFYKRKREAAFKNEVSETEMKALRSQMNPHFIFNSLNSIKGYMASHDNKTAADYLTKFASVMRMILENSEHREVPLEQDLKALELYMQLESLRMKKKFKYEIKLDESIDKENTLIPPLILQPFVENSIWHGIAEKEGEGKIDIYISKEGEMLQCTVEDNGVGRAKSNVKSQKSKEPQVEKKSLGMKITNARINILNKIKKSKASVELIDLEEGMKVVVRLPLELSF